MWIGEPWTRGYCEVISTARTTSEGLYGRIETTSGPEKGPAGSQAQDPATQEAEEHEESAMELQMERVEEAMRLLRRSIRKPEARADSVGHVQECQEGFLLAKAMTPLLLANIPEAEQSAFKRDFRLAVIEAMEAFLDLERALLEERDDDARQKRDGYRCHRCKDRAGAYPGDYEKGRRTFDAAPAAQNREMNLAKSGPN